MFNDIQKRLLTGLILAALASACETTNRTVSTATSAPIGQQPMHCSHPSQFGDMEFYLTPTDAGHGTATLENGGSFQAVTANYLCLRHPADLPKVPAGFALLWRCTANGGAQDVAIVAQTGEPVMAWIKSDKTLELLFGAPCGL